MTLASPALSLRAPEPADLDLLYRLENLPEVWRVTLGDAPVSRQMLWQYLNDYKADIYADRQLRFVACNDGTPVGTVDITDFDPRNSRALLGVAIDPSCQRQGYGTEALRLAIEYCREVLSLHQLAAIVPRDNEASLALFRKLGFKSSGCLRSWLRRGGRYTDALVLQLMLRAS